MACKKNSGDVADEHPDVNEGDTAQRRVRGADRVVLQVAQPKRRQRQIEPTIETAIERLIR